MFILFNVSIKYFIWMENAFCICRFANKYYSILFMALHIRNMTYMEVSWHNMNVTRRYMDVTLRYMDVTWRYMAVTWRYIDVAWRYLDITRQWAMWSSFRGLNTLDKFSAIFHKEGNFNEYLFVLLYTKHFLNGLLYKEAELFFFFFFRVDPFSSLTPTPKWLQ